MTHPAHQSRSRSHTCDRFVLVPATSSKRVASTLNRVSSSSLILITSILISITILGCDTSTPNTLDPDERALYEWIKSRADLVRRHKSDCDAMARALVTDYESSASQLKGWRAAKVGFKLSERLLHAPLESRELTFILENTSELYAYCAHQRSFRKTTRELSSSLK